MTIAEWVAVDWGTTNLRAWAMRGDTAIDEASSSDGMASLSRDAFEPALLRVIGHWLDRRIRVIACGMVGSRQGWAEAPYRAVPCSTSDIRLIRAPSIDPRLDVRLIPGVKQENPADVMRGEETQIAGYLRHQPDFDGVICLPGTHTKWAHISAGEIVSFRTFLTGELFALLANASILRHSVAAQGWDDDAFGEAVSEALSRPEKIGASLFGLRANSLLFGTAPETARARLSGLLIGIELAAARPYWLGQNVVLIGAHNLAQTYQSALAAQGLTARMMDGTDMTLAGLSMAHEMERTPQ